MKFLHTSDWHLGRTLYGKKRYEEFEAFLNWLADKIDHEKVDVLLIAGDVFDTTTPSNQAQSLYYHFLCKISQSNCKHVVIIAGNHDSPTFLTAPKQILAMLNVHIVGMKSDNIADEVITLFDNNIPQAIICAVPYLRDKDIRTLEPGESIDEKNNKLVKGLRDHYHSVCEHAESIKASFPEPIQSTIPIIGMGHLFASGGKTAEGDGVRELYVGSLAHVGADIFPSALDYVALGHLHIPQLVSQIEHIRYSGSPIAMGFGEAGQQKHVIIVNFKANKSNIETIEVPIFQPLVRIKGDLDIIEARLHQLVAENSSAWLEIEYSGKSIIADLRVHLDELISGSMLEIRRIKNRLIFDSILQQEKIDESLEDLSELDVFYRCLDANNVLESEREELVALYQHTLKSLNEYDVNQE
ncbi:exonuclease SbcCD subunit D C-terminal domain-containing protein [Thorsellia anophelis]|uniref:Nuclease SbcCD subunit D n=1 Tax=Thorsellia anophelis DSM 18579 TaxID=1123402 RepID=A0A1I0CSJ5_9GAMM|nr:exonuclease SbcCD subunit D C-terminal domain-containing protein [Thorsellia anophelis]SET22777.1 Exodeoxyribonuclease I subunit D [Thorsellia anophelis DSM 18579]